MGFIIKDIFFKEICAKEEGSREQRDTEAKGITVTSCETPLPSKLPLESSLEKRGIILSGLKLESIPLNFWSHRNIYIKILHRDDSSAEKVLINSHLCVCLPIDQK